MTAGNSTGRLYTEAEDFHLRLADLEPAAADRVRKTIACRDTDHLPKVPGAGGVIDRNGELVQVMHNGLLIEEGCYYGPWMTEIIRGLAGHHEPQEEVVFDAIVRRLRQSGSANPLIVEFGSFWAYYTMWFCRELPGARGLAMEPDPVYLEIGRRNAELNGLSDRISFTHGAVGAAPGETTEFVAESTGRPVQVQQYDLASFLAQKGVQRVDLAMVDIQGFESVLLPRAREMLRAGAVRFLLVSTHHQTISGDALTHQQALQLLDECGGHIIAEHSVRESYSGDGLIAVAFDPRDTELTVPVSHARAKDTLFGEPEYELAALAAMVAERDQTLEHYQRHVGRIESELAVSGREVENLRTARADSRNADPSIAPEPPVSRPDEDLASDVSQLRAELAAARDEVASVQKTKIWRWSSTPRRLYGTLRRRYRRPS